MFALSLVELFAVHFFIALRWPMIGWPLTILSAAAAVWMVFWIRSFRRLPHGLDRDGLTLRLGLLKGTRVDLAQIARVSRGWEQGAVKARDAINLAAISYPNRCIELAGPIRRGKSRIFIRLDEPEGFDSAMLEAGIPVA
ncbi:MAG: hypothetical protein IE933_00195 [Sphingomonadales bacterium]|nr:hypothetical protein [Sphingomonadales bacterium]MBD3772745.1 hypothetical protein [Paracoccaceae bacterium]